MRNLRDLEGGGTCLVCRPKSKDWQPYTLISMENEASLVQNPQRRTIFSRVW